MYAARKFYAISSRRDLGDWSILQYNKKVQTGLWIGEYSYMFEFAGYQKCFHTEHQNVTKKESEMLAL